MLHLQSGYWLPCHFLFQRSPIPYGLVFPTLTLFVYSLLLGLYNHPNYHTVNRMTVCTYKCPFAVSCMPIQIIINNTKPFIRIQQSVLFIVYICVYTEQINSKNIERKTIKMNLIYFLTCNLGVLHQVTTFTLVSNSSKSSH